jgi:hypothetical protein
VRFDWDVGEETVTFRLCGIGEEFWRCEMELGAVAYTETRDHEHAVNATWLTVHADSFGEGGMSLLMSSQRADEAMVEINDALKRVRS